MTARKHVKIVVLDGHTLNPGDISWKPIEELGELTVYKRTAPWQVKRRIGKAQVVLTNRTRLDAKTLARVPQVKYIGVLADNDQAVDLDYAKSKGIVVRQTSFYGIQAVAQMTIALLLELCNHVWIHNEQVKNGVWCAGKDFCFWSEPLWQLAGKKMGVIGFNEVGQLVAKFAQDMGMTVLASANNKKPLAESETLRYVSLKTIFADCDVISLHCSTTAETHKLINQQTIAQMKREVVLINTAGGELIDEKALAQALHDGKIRGAALDVLSEEPPKGDNPLLFEENCIITPHIAWAAQECRVRLMEMAAKNLQNFLVGTPENTV